MESFTNTEIHEIHEYGYCLIEFDQIFKEIKKIIENDKVKKYEKYKDIDIELFKTNIKIVLDILNNNFFNKIREVIGEIKKPKNENIGNYIFKKAEENDPNRFQIFITKKDKENDKDDEYNNDLSSYIDDDDNKMQIFDFIELYKTALKTLLNINKTHVAKDIVVIHSKKGGETQQEHTDYVLADTILINNVDQEIGLPDQMEQLCNDDKCVNKNIPLAAIIGLQDNTNILGWPGYIYMKQEFLKKYKEDRQQTLDEYQKSSGKAEMELKKYYEQNQSKNKLFEKKNPTKIIYNTGDVFVFRGDFVHAGASFEEDNSRIHIYFDNKKIRIYYCSLMLKMMDC